MRHNQRIRKRFGNSGNGGFASTFDLAGKLMRPIPNRLFQRVRKTLPKTHEKCGNAFLQVFRAEFVHGPFLR